MGNVPNANEWYQAFDLFVLPSIWEGLPVVGVEAQYAGLPCFFSDKVPEEVKFTEGSYFISLDESVTKWAEKILSVTPTISRKLEDKYVQDSIYNIEKSYEELEKLYFELHHKI